MLCENTCIGADCESVFLSTEAIGLDPFGEIAFECQGPSTDDVTGTFIIIDGEPGFCDGTDPDENGFNLNTIQLGVLCPTDDAGGESYLIDDLHSDCGVQNRALNVFGSYTCFNGMACGATPCQVEFGDQLIISSDPHRFMECITTSDGSPAPEVSPPEQPEWAAGLYTAQFQAVWFFLLDDSCRGTVSPKEITCTNGNIRLVESQVEGCNVIENRTIQCSDTGLSGSMIFVSQFMKWCNESVGFNLILLVRLFYLSPAGM